MPPDDVKIGYPLRLGAIDVGSNAIRFFAVEYTGPETRVPLQVDRYDWGTGRSSPGD